MGRPRTRPIKYDAEIGLALYEPTPKTPKFRLDYTDPFTGERSQPKRTLESDAFALWDETVTYLRMARQAVPLELPTGRRREPTVDDLFDVREAEWQENGCSDRYIEKRRGLYEYRLGPVFGDWTVRRWAASTDGPREVLRLARVDGLSASYVQDIGALMRGLVSLGHDKNWIQPGHDPMRKVKYVAGSQEQDASSVFVTEDDRPEFEAVEALIVAYEELAKETGIWWLPERAMLGAYCGHRPGERDATRPCDLRPEELFVDIKGSISWPKQGPIRKLPKNGKRRTSLAPVHVMDRLLVVAERRRSEGAAEDDLLFEDPSRPGRPLSESATTGHYTEAALRAGWPTVAVRRRAGSRRHLGPDHRPRHPNYSLRHHSAVWMYNRAGYDWTDVSRYLGHHSVAFTHAVYNRSGADADERNRARLRAM